MMRMRRARDVHKRRIDAPLLKEHGVIASHQRRATPMRVIGRRAAAATRRRAGLESDGARRRRYDAALRRQGVQRGEHQRRRDAHDAHTTWRLFE
jgi:hypothetical protein